MGQEFTHISSDGSVEMVDVSSKKDSVRIAIYKIEVIVSKSTYELLKQKALPKGDALNTAKIAGILAAKKTSSLIPLCHPIPLTHVDITFKLDDKNHKITIEATSKTTSKTGVEIEAMVAAHIAAITIYDMCKAVQKDVVISNGCLKYKSGGKSGTYQLKEPQNNAF